MKKLFTALFLVGFAYQVFGQKSVNTNGNQNVWDTKTFRNRLEVGSANPVVITDGDVNAGAGNMTANTATINILGMNAGTAATFNTLVSNTAAVLHSRGLMFADSNIVAGDGTWYTGDLNTPTRIGGLVSGTNASVSVGTNIVHRWTSSGMVYITGLTNGLGGNRACLRVIRYESQQTNIWLNAATSEAAANRLSTIIGSSITNFGPCVTIWNWSATDQLWHLVSFDNGGYGTNITTSANITNPVPFISITGLPSDNVALNAFLIRETTNLNTLTANNLVKGAGNSGVQDSGIPISTMVTNNSTNTILNAAFATNSTLHGNLDAQQLRYQTMQTLALTNVALNTNKLIIENTLTAIFQTLSWSDSGGGAWTNSTARYISNAGGFYIGKFINGTGNVYSNTTAIASGTWVSNGIVFSQFNTFHPVNTRWGNFSQASPQGITITSTDTVLTGVNRLMSSNVIEGSLDVLNSNKTVNFMMEPGGNVIFHHTNGAPTYVTISGTDLGLFVSSYIVLAQAGSHPALQVSAMFNFVPDVEFGMVSVPGTASHLHTWWSDHMNSVTAETNAAFPQGMMMYDLVRRRRTNQMTTIDLYNPAMPYASIEFISVSTNNNTNASFGITVTNNQLNIGPVYNSWDGGDLDAMPKGTGITMDTNGYAFVLDPTATNGIATKGYVDNSLGGGGVGVIYVTNFVIWHGDFLSTNSGGIQRTSWIASVSGVDERFSISNRFTGAKFDHYTNRTVGYVAANFDELLRWQDKTNILNLASNPPVLVAGSIFASNINSTTLNSFDLNVTNTSRQATTEVAVLYVTNVVFVNGLNVRMIPVTNNSSYSSGTVFSNLTGFDIIGIGQLQVNPGGGGGTTAQIDKRVSGLIVNENGVLFNFVPQGLGGGTVAYNTFLTEILTNRQSLSYSNNDTGGSAIGWGMRWFKLSAGN